MAEATLHRRNYQVSALFSYGFRPFFLGGAIFSAIAVPAWILSLSSEYHFAFLYAPRDWHTHEMLFGFLAAVITGFLLTAIPNWTNRPPVSGRPLMLLFSLWLAGRLAIGASLMHPLISALIDGVYLLVVGGIVWREIVAGDAWDRLPIGLLISLYAFANVLFHGFFLTGTATVLPERMALAVVMVLLALIGGRLTPTFTHDFLVEQGMTGEPATVSGIDGVSIILVIIAALGWFVQPQAMATGWLMVAAGLGNLVRLLRWHGWLAWREPLVLILHVGYGWLAISLLLLGGAILGFGMAAEEAVHGLTTGAIGTMTLAVMTRASLGHTGRPKHAGILTVLIYFMVNLGAILRVFAPITEFSKTLMLGFAATCWSGAYIMFVVVYGPMLLRPSRDEP